MYVCVRVCGAGWTGDAAAARWSAVVAGSITCGIGAVIFVVLFCCRNFLGKMFSHDPVVLDETATLTPMLAGAWGSAVRDYGVWLEVESLHAPQSLRVHLLVMWVWCVLAHTAAMVQV